MQHVQQMTSCTHLCIQIITHTCKHVHTNDRLPVVGKFLVLSKVCFQTIARAGNYKHSHTQTCNQHPLTRERLGRQKSQEKENCPCIFAKFSPAQALAEYSPTMPVATSRLCPPAQIGTSSGALPLGWRFWERDSYYLAAPIPLFTHANSSQTWTRRTRKFATH